MNKFEKEVFDRTKSYQDNADLIKTARLFQLESVYAKYSYNFHSLGRPIIQYPQDIVAIQEIIWKVRPDLIIETGIAHGGSLIMSASMLAPALSNSFSVIDSPFFLLQTSSSEVIV